MGNPSLQIDFFKKLLAWYSENHRPMPWKNIKDPYLIWVSEIILQQTRVSQGWSYYENFKSKFPHLKNLAEADLHDVLKAWEGLGYYTRARNLHKTAKYIHYELNGTFPASYEALLKLPGIGEYTAAAISSFAFGLPYAVVDGNVIRVLSRYFGIGSSGLNDGLLKLKIKDIATSIIKNGDPAVFNQAIMDFGATCCVPSNPDCNKCPVKLECFAFNNNMVDIFPPKKKKLQKKDRWFNFYLIKFRDGIYIQNRLGNDIWKNLFQLPCIETESFDDLNVQQDFVPNDLIVDVITPAKIYKHVLTHQTIYASFSIFELKTALIPDKDDLIYAERKNLCNFAFPKLIQKFLREQELV